MDRTYLDRLDDEQLIALKQASEGLPFEAHVQAAIDARVAALVAERDALVEKVRTVGRELAADILACEPNADTAWFFVDLVIDTGNLKERRVARHALDALLDAHYPPALATQGRLLLKGADGIEIDPHAAFRLFERGARCGDPMAIYWLGYCLERGIGCEPDVLRALDWYETVRESPHLELKVARARLYQRGLGLKALRADLPSLHQLIVDYHALYLADDATTTRVTRPSAAEAAKAYLKEFGRSMA
ncbi:MAG: tetratricopeptide repeat protein [Caulobacterales bacterium]